LREDLQRNHRALTQQKRLEDSRHRHQPGDWRLILQHLIESTPTHAKPEDGIIKVSIPKDSIERLLSDRENNVWNIKSRTGCLMKLYNPPDSEGGSDVGQDRGEGSDPYLIIGGQPAAITAAVKDIQEVARGVTVTRLHGDTVTLLQDGQADHTPAQGQAASPVLYPGPSGPYILTNRVDQLLQPKEWTIESFQQYIAEITMGRMPGALARELYPGPGRHKTSVVQQIHAVFNDPVASAAVSSPAFKSALTYLVRSGESLVHEAQKLYERASVLGVRMDTEVFNIMAQTSVRAKNMLAFQSTIRLMLVRGHQPNLRTWVLFLRLIEAEEVRRYIIQAMHTKNFFVDPRAVIAVSNEMGPNDAYRAIQLNQDVETFLASQRDIYGPYWRLTRHAANSILYEFGRHGRFEESRQILEVMFASPGRKPSVITLNTVLTHCRNLHKIDDAIKILRLFEERDCHVANSITYELLFDMARQAKKPHLLTMVWRYAHLLDAANWRIRNGGLMLLSGGRELEKLTSRLQGLWTSDPPQCRSSPQEFIEMLLFADYNSINGKKYLSLDLGTPADGEDVMSETPSPSETPEPLSESPLTPSDTPEAFSETPSAPSKPPTIADEKYTIFSKWATRRFRKREPKAPLGHLLREALDRDLQLHQLAWNGPSPLHDDVQDGMQLPAMEPVALPTRLKQGHVLKHLVLYSEGGKKGGEVMEGEEGEEEEEAEAASAAEAEGKKRPNEAKRVRKGIKGGSYIKLQLTDKVEGKVEESGENILEKNKNRWGKPTNWLKL
jgi:hypothetical protein